VSGGPGIIWFVAEDSAHEGLTRYAEPDIIRIVGDQRWRDTVLWRHGKLVRIMHVVGERVGADGALTCPIDPRGPGLPAHGDRSVTTNYQSSQESQASRASQLGQESQSSQGTRTKGEQ
jgi:hypothetical protein